jgi:hypothetical protein
MDDAAPVYLGQGGGQGEGELEDVARLDRSPYLLREVGTSQVLQHEHGPILMHGQAESRDDAGDPFETPQELVLLLEAGVLARTWVLRAVRLEEDLALIRLADGTGVEVGTACLKRLDQREPWQPNHVSPPGDQRAHLMTARPRGRLGSSFGSVQKEKALKLHGANPRNSKA